jgi:WD40 repeat protein
MTSRLFHDATKSTVALAIGMMLLSSVASAQRKALAPQKPVGKGTYDEVSRFTEHTGAINAMALSPGGRYIASAGADRAIHIVDAKTWKSVRKSAADADVKDLAFTRSGDLIIAGDNSPKYKTCVYVWQWNANKVAFAWNDAATAVSIAASPDGKILGAVESDGRTRLYCVEQKATFVLEDAHATYRRTTIGFSPDSKTITTGGKNGFVHRWRHGIDARYLRKGPNQAFAPDFRSPLRATVYAPNGSCVATAHDDGTARIYLEKAKLRYRLMGHAGGALCVAFSPDSKYLASGGNDKTIRVWEIGTGQLLWEIAGHSGAVTRVLAPSPDTIVSASADGTIRFWRRAGGAGGTGAADLAGDAPRVRPARKSSLPVPKTDVVAKSKSLIKDLFAADFAKATDDTGRRGLVTKLLAQARQAENLPEERYAALELAETMAIDAKAVQLAIEAADEFGVWFEGDGRARLVNVVAGLGKTCRSPQERTLLATVSVRLASEAAAEDRFLDATRMLEVAASAAAGARKSDLQDAVKAASDRIEKAKAALATYENALKLLATNSTDPAANLVAGRFLCFVRGDWAKGVAHLARCSDERLRKAAEKELAKPESSEDWETLGDLWQAAAIAAEESDRPSCSASAEFAYRKALEEAAGLRKVKIQRSLDEVGPVPQRLRRRESDAN